MSCTRSERWMSAVEKLDDLGSERHSKLLDHLSACSDCRRRALTIEPTLLFAELAAVTVGAEEVESVRSTVQAMRRVRDLERPAGHRSDRLWKIAAAVILLVGLLVLAPTRNTRQAPPNPSRVGEEIERRDLWEQEVLWQDSESGTALIEGLNLPAARIYQLTRDDIAVVMIVDETLDL